MNIERQYLKQLHEAVSSSYMDNLKKARTLAEEVLLPKLKQFGKDNNVSFEDAKVRMMDSVIVITNFELTKRYGREIITADKNVASMKREKQLISQIKQVVEDFVKDSLVKELHINPDSEIAFEDNHIYIEMAGKGLYEALNQEAVSEKNGVTDGFNQLKDYLATQVAALDINNKQEYFDRISVAVEHLAIVAAAYQEYKETKDKDMIETCYSELHNIESSVLAITE